MTSKISKYLIVGFAFFPLTSYAGQVAGGGGGGATALPREDYDYILNGALGGKPVEINGEEFKVKKFNFEDGGLEMSAADSGKVLKVLPSIQPSTSYSPRYRPGQGNKWVNPGMKQLSEEALRELSKAAGEQN